MKGQPNDGRVDTLGHRIRWARQHNTDLGRHQFARALGINVFRAKAIEDGREPIVPKPLLATIAKAVKSSPEWLKYGTEKERFFAVKDVHPRIDEQDHTQEGNAAMTDEPMAPLFAASPAQPTVESVWPAAPPPAPVERPAPKILPAKVPTSVEPPQKSPLAERVRQRREALGLSIEALAEETGVRVRAIEAVEAGQSQNPIYLPQLARALEVNETWLKTGERGMMERVTLKSLVVKASDPTPTPIEPPPPPPPIEAPPIEVPPTVEPVEPESPPNQIADPAPETTVVVDKEWTGQEIAAERHRLGLTQTALIDRLDVSKRFALSELSKLEHGHPVSDRIHRRVIEALTGTEPPATPRKSLPRPITIRDDEITITPEIGARVREARVAMAMSAVELGRLVNRSAWYITQLERAGDVLRTGSLPQIADELCVTLDHLLNGPVPALSALEMGRSDGRPTGYERTVETASSPAPEPIQPPAPPPPAPEPVPEPVSEPEPVPEPPPPAARPPEKLTPEEFFIPITLPANDWGSLAAAVEPVINPITEVDVDMVDGVFYLLYRLKRHHLTAAGEFGGTPELIHVAAVSMSPLVAKKQLFLLGEAIETYEAEMGEIVVPRQASRRSR